MIKTNSLCSYILLAQEEFEENMKFLGCFALVLLLAVYISKRQINRISQMTVGDATIISILFYGIFSIAGAI